MPPKGAQNLREKEAKSVGHGREEGVEEASRPRKKQRKTEKKKETERKKHLLDVEKNEQTRRAREERRRR